MPRLVRPPSEVVPLLVADIFHLAGSLRKSGDRIARRVGRTQAEWQFLSAASDGGRSVPQIARRLGFARQSVQRTADLLVSDGLAHYVENPDHRRSPLVELTTTGRTVLEQISASARVFHRELANNFNNADLDRAERLLRRLCAIVDPAFSR